MTTAAATERVNKLREICVERGATAHEAATAQALAARLCARYGIDRPAAAAPHVARYAASARGDRRAARSLRFVTFA